MTNLSHRASFHSKEKIEPSNRGIKHLGVENYIGSSGEDVVNGSSADNLLDGEGGDDILNGRAGNDTLIGGSGVDTFVFKVGDGQDQISDFEDGSDLLDFTASGLTFADLTITSDADGAAWIFYGTDDSIQLLNAGGQIDASDFVFA